MTTTTSMTDAERRELEARLRADDQLRKAALTARENAINALLAPLISSDEYVEVRQQLQDINTSTDMAGTKFSAHVSGLLNIMSNLESQVS